MGLAAKLGELAMAMLDAQEEDQQQSHSGDCGEEEMEDETRSSSRLGFQVGLATNLRRIRYFRLLRWIRRNFDNNGKIKNCFR